MLRPCLLLLLVLLSSAAATNKSSIRGFVRAKGTQFIVNGRSLYVNGFNAYWLSHFAMDPSERPRLNSFFSEAARHGLNLVRTWAFRDGGDRAIQISPGVYSEQALRGLDFVVAEAKKHRMRVLLSLSNNWSNWGGKAQYVQWAKHTRSIGQSANEDAFFSDPVIKTHYKNYIKTILTRVNTFTNIPYNREPAIFGWELMNEARCPSDASGKTLRAWIQEMAKFIKCLDPNHMVEIGSEGFYSSKSIMQATPPLSGQHLGTDFLADNALADIDFAAVHTYPDQWLTQPSVEKQVNFLGRWIRQHVEDARTKLRKPLLFSEFGMSKKTTGYKKGEMDWFISSVYANILSNRPSAGGMVWQIFADFVPSDWDDGYAIVLSRDTSIARMIAEQSAKVAILNQ